MTNIAPLPSIGNSAPMPRAAILGAVALIVVAGFSAYHNTFSVPFLFDDVPSIADNASIRHLWPIWDALSPPVGGLTVSGRPVVNLTFAVNYAISGTKVWSYHAFNLAIHLAAGLTLFGIMRRTLQQPLLQARFGRNALPLAMVVALVWTTHPLQTEAVTYLSQRAESLMSLFYLLTLYCLVRSAVALVPWRWYALAISACALGMASKEVMVSAPLIVLLYDRTLLSSRVAGTFRGAWRRRWPCYLGLFSTWLLLGWLVAGSGGRGGTAGLNTNVAWWVYALTQCRGIVHYLRLAVWPSLLAFDYGFAVVTSVAQVGGQAAILAGLLTVTVVALGRWPAIGFAGAVFFAVLAPSSSVIPVATQIMAEHRMYLALAPVLALLVLGLYHWLGRGIIIAGVGWAVVLAGLTVQRNMDYRSELSLWQDSVAKCPGSARAQNNLGKALYDLGRIPEALAHIEESLRLGPPLAAAHFNLGLILARRGRREEARSQYEEAVRLNPEYAEAQLNLGVCLLEADKIAEALPYLTAAARLKPDLPEAHCNLGNALARSGRLAEALGEYAAALRLRSDYALAHYNYGNALLTLGRNEEAVVQYQAAVRLQPGNPDAHDNLGIALRKVDRLDEAREEFERASVLRHR